MTEQTIGRGLRLPYGKITGNEVVDKLTKYNISKKQIKIDGALATLGIHIVKVELHKKVVANIKVQLVNNKYIFIEKKWILLY